MTPLSAEARSRLEALFPERARAAAAKLLEERCGETLPLSRGVSPEAFDRIRFAVLKLSGGDLRKLRLHIDEANRDWRDTLVAAGFGCDVDAHRAWFPMKKAKLSLLPFVTFIAAASMAESVGPRTEAVAPDRSERRSCAFLRR